MCSCAVIGFIIIGAVKSYREQIRAAQYSVYQIKNMKLTSKQITQIIPETERIIKPSNLIRKVGCIVENSDGVMICAQCGHEQPYTTGSTWRGTACTHCKTIFIKKAKKEE